MHTYIYIYKYIERVYFVCTYILITCAYKIFNIHCIINLIMNRFKCEICLDEDLNIEVGISLESCSHIFCKFV